MKYLVLVAIFNGLYSAVRTTKDDSSSSEESHGVDALKKCKDPNSYWTECASVCPKTCSNWWNHIACFACRPGCTCKKGFVLNKYNRCVRISQCPKPICEDPRRKWNPQGPSCPPACPGVYNNRVCTLQLVPGCFCRDGYLEDGKGNCVEPSHCPKPVCKDPRREYLECGSACPPSCKNLNESSVVCTKQCVSACFCKVPYVEDDHGNCVEECECPKPICTDPNRHYESCGSECPESCYKDKKICTDACVSGCFCNKGLVENGNGECIPKKFCNKCSDPNKYYTNCGTACPATCDNWWCYDKLPCTKQCVPGCFCIDGLVEDGNGKCVDPNQCHVCKDPNREFLECGSACPDTCDNINDIDRICTLQCINGCFCKPPLVEDANRNCINRTCCPNPTCEDPNKYYTSCGSACPITCKNRCDPPICPWKHCVEGCFCRPWLIDDGYGNCIDPNTCPTDSCKCPGNAVWNDCGGCDGTCKDPHPSCTKECKKGCFCRPGQVRNDENVCIPYKLCFRH